MSEDKLVKAEKGSLPFVLMDAADDALILAELEGRILDTWVYEFTSGGQKVQGLSKVGIDQATRELAKKGEVLRELECGYHVDPTDKNYVLFTVKVGRFAISKEGQEILLDTAIGAKRQWTKMARRDGRVVSDPFWFEKGLAKAARNAKQRLLPEEIKTKILTFAKEKGRVQKVESPIVPEQPADEQKEPHKAAKGWFIDYMAAMQELKAKFVEMEKVGTYYAVLGDHGFEHANEVRSRQEAERVYKALKEQLSFMEEMKDVLGGKDGRKDQPES